MSYNDFERSREFRESISASVWSTTFLVAEYLWKTPEMEFSERVDIVPKKIRWQNIDFSQSYDVDKKRDNFFSDSLRIWLGFNQILTKSLRDQKAPKI